MRRMSWLATTMAAAFFVAGLSAQGKPNFSGKWTNTAPPPAAPAGGGAPGAGGPGGPGGGGGRGGGGRGGGGGGFCGQECTITQDATTLTVARTTQAGEQKATYKLDGSESKNPGRGGQDVVSKAVWEGNNLAITTQNPGRDGGPGVTQKVVVSMNAGQMEVETSTEGGGGGGRGGGGAGKQTYKKN